MNLIVLAPHFAPDVAPTGDVVTSLVENLGRRGHTIDVITSLPWYGRPRVEEPFAGRLYRYEDAPWGRITRVHPFPTADKRNIARRALGYAAFSLLVGVMGARGARSGHTDAVVALSPPLSLGPVGWAIARLRRAPFVFNVQDVYPDVAVSLGALAQPRLIEAARKMERFSYDKADAITVLSDDMRDNIAAKTSRPDKITVIPNFVDTSWITPRDADNSYRQEFGLSGRFVVMYAGNVGLSQSFDPVLDAAAALAHEPDVVFVINGHGAMRAELQRRARGMDNVVFVDMQPAERLPEVLAAADVHLVPLKRGLGRTSVPSKTYSIMAAGRPLIASVDEGSEIAHVVQRSAAGITVAPGDAEALTKAIRRLMEDPEEARAMGRAARRFVEGWASPEAVTDAYVALFEELAAARSPAA